MTAAIKSNVRVGGYYYASTPRSAALSRRERVKVLTIEGRTATVVTVDPLRKKEVYRLSKEAIS